MYGLQGMVYISNKSEGEPGFAFPEGFPEGKASVYCLDISCSDASHSSERESLVLDILINIIEVSHDQIPLVGGRIRKSNERRGSGSKPGWTETVEPYRRDAIFWLSVWRSAGMPKTGELHSIMVKTRNKYHYAVRRAKKSADFVRAQKLFEAAELGGVKLFEELKNVSKNSGADLPENVAGANGENEIVGKFRDVYQTLYSAWGSQAEMVTIK